MSSVLIEQSLDIYKSILLLTPEQRLFMRYQYAINHIAELEVMGIVLRSFTDLEDFTQRKGLSRIDQIRLTDQLALMTGYYHVEMAINATDCLIPYHMFSKIANDRNTDKNFNENAVSKLFQAIPRKLEFRQWMFLGHTTMVKVPYTCGGKHQVAIWRDMETLNAHSD